MLLLFQGGLRQLNILDKALVHVFLIGDGTVDRAGLNGELHKLLEIRPDDAQVAVRDPVGRATQDELQGLGFRIEDIQPPPLPLRSGQITCLTDHFGSSCLTAARLLEKYFDPTEVRKL
jgi:hypothetical protein